MKPGAGSGGRWRDGLASLGHGREGGMFVYGTRRVEAKGSSDSLSEPGFSCWRTKVAPTSRSQKPWTLGRLAFVPSTLCVSKDQVWRILRLHDICLERRRSWCIVGLYLNPPENTLVLAVDEKPSIPAWEWASGYLRLPNGQAVNAFSHGYKSHGATTLFAALEITTGLVKAGDKRERAKLRSLRRTEEQILSRPIRRP